MCGIVAYLGEAPPEPILLEGLRRLEYRGYDSAGIALMGEAGNLEVRKTSGKIADLAACVSEKPFQNARAIGIAHTRWATHGDPIEENAHPHLSSDGDVAVVHNGTIENYARLREELTKEGCYFKSQTDTEVLPNLIARELERGANTLEDAVARALRYVDGAYGIAVIARDHREVVAACNSSPLSVGLNGTAVFVASDHEALAGYASHHIVMNDGDIVTLYYGGDMYRFRPRQDVSNDHPLEVMTLRPEELDKGVHAHYMLKEILEQPQTTRSALGGRLRGDTVKFGGLNEEAERRLAFADRITFVACGTSLYAAMAGKMFIEGLARIPTEAVHASEFIYGDPILDSGDALIGVSQSGTTADTLQAIRLGKKTGALCVGINNRVGSTLAREVGRGNGIYLHAGAETAVASTKAFTSQVLVFLLLALRLAHLRKRGDPQRIASIREALEQIPALMQEALNAREKIATLAHTYAQAPRFFFLGRGFAVPLAYEAALKVKEISYVSAEGYPGGELKHGPLALIEEGVPVVAILGNDLHGKKMISNMEEVVSRGGHVIALTSGDVALRSGLAKAVIPLPAVPSELLPLVGAPAVQLLAYYLGVARGNDVDKPRNLAKSVTVE